MKLEMKENLCVSLSEEKNILKAQLSLVEEERRTEGRNLESMILERVMKARDEDVRTKERSLAELKERSLKEQAALKEKVLLLEESLKLMEREVGVVRTYVQTLHIYIGYLSIILINTHTNITTISYLSLTFVIRKIPYYLTGYLTILPCRLCAFLLHIFYFYVKSVSTYKL